jgi:alkylation response protein AidB-like acyl-CoA dehydrogenase
VVAYARHEPAHWAGKADDVSVTAMDAGSGWRLNGVKSPVRHGAQADMLIVSAQTGAKPGCSLCKVTQVLAARL